MAVVVLPSSWSLDVDGYHRLSIGTRMRSWSRGLGLQASTNTLAFLKDSERIIQVKNTNMAKSECLDPFYLQDISPSNECYTSVAFTWNMNPMSPVSQPLDKLNSPGSPPALQEFSWMYVVVQSQRDALPILPPVQTSVLSSVDCSEPRVCRRRPAAWSLGLGLAPPPPQPSPRIIPGGPSSMRFQRPPTTPEHAPALIS
jgi:hypothetical protein